MQIVRDFQRATSDRLGDQRKRALVVMIVCGEASSDEHGAALIHALRASHPNLSVFGMGGSMLRTAGVETTVNSEESASVMGFTELFGSLRKLIHAFRVLTAEARLRKPDVVILIDFPDFNLRLAKRLSRDHFSVVYYISPQLWAWRKGRVKTMKKYISRILTIFPFEEHFYHANGVQAEFVGHPFLDRKPLAKSKVALRDELGIANKLLPVLALLPGSRRAEVERILPVMLGALRRVKKSRPGLVAVIPVAPSLDLNWVKAFSEWDDEVVFVQGKAQEVLECADLAVVTSGTATVQAALAQVPHLVVYRMTPVSYRIARLLVRGVKHFAMVNLIAGKTLVTELLQDEVTSERVSAEIEQLLGDPAKREQLAEELRVVGRSLLHVDRQNKSVAARAADAVLQVICEREEKGKRRSVAGGAY